MHRAHEPQLGVDLRISRDLRIELRIAPLLLSAPARRRLARRRLARRRLAE
jgi:hypothetical protein